MKNATIINRRNIKVGIEYEQVKRPTTRSDLLFLRKPRCLDLPDNIRWSDLTVALEFFKLK